MWRSFRTHVYFISHSRKFHNWSSNTESWWLLLLKKILKKSPFCDSTTVWILLLRNNCNMTHTMKGSEYHYYLWMSALYSIHKKRIPTCLSHCARASRWARLLTTHTYIYIYTYTQLRLFWVLSLLFLKPSLPSDSAKHKLRYFTEKRIPIVVETTDFTYLCTSMAQNSKT